jgi:4-amino-4-deoxychorismate lyase
MQPQHCLVNGQSTDRLSNSDRGLLYGDGLFETMAVIDGTIPLWSRHLRRLQHGCQRLHLACPPVDILQSEIQQLSHAAPRAVLKLILTRGEGGRGYAPASGHSPTRIVQRHPWPDTPRANWEPGINVRYCATRLARQPALAGIKHLNRLEQVLARAEWQDPTIQEGLVRDNEGNIIEATSHNLFIVTGTTVSTPDLSQCGVAGVMREHILAMLQADACDVRVAKITDAEVRSADAVFLCNSIHGIWPICELEGKHYAPNRLVCDLRERVAHLIPYP